MKVIVTARNNDLDSQVDPRFGRGAWFLVVDLENDEFESIDNSAGVAAGQGAGVMAAQKAAASGAKALLTGHCGPKAFDVLSEVGIDVYTGIEGTVRDAVARYRAGDLEPSGKPDVDSRW